MKKTKLLYTIITAHVLFIFLHVYKHTKIVSARYNLEKSNAQYRQLKKEKLALQEEWYTIQDPHYLRNHAREQLGMKKIRLHQTRHIEHANSNA